MKSKSAIIADTIISYKDTRARAWIDSFHATVGSRIKIEGNKNIWIIEKVISRYPRKIVHEAEAIVEYFL